MLFKFHFWIFHENPWSRSTYFFWVILVLFGYVAPLSQVKKALAKEEFVSPCFWKAPSFLTVHFKFSFPLISVTASPPSTSHLACLLASRVCVDILSSPFRVLTVLATGKLYPALSTKRPPLDKASFLKIFPVPLFVMWTFHSVSFFCNPFWWIHLRLTLSRSVILK